MENILKEPIISDISNFIVKCIITRCDCLDVPINLIKFAGFFEIVEYDAEYWSSKDTKARNISKLFVFSL